MFGELSSKNRGLSDENRRVPFGDKTQIKSRDSVITIGYLTVIKSHNSSINNYFRFKLTIDF